MIDDYPLLVAANRDEHYDRPSSAPGLHGSNPIILAGRDLLAGGTWLGVNEYGLWVGILNRRATSDPVLPTRSRSRGLLCLDLLGFKSAGDAHAFVRSREETYQPFTVLFADRLEAWAAYNVQGELKTLRLEPGLHVFSNTAEFSAQSGKLDRAYRQFSAVLGKLQLNPRDASRWLHLLTPVLGDHTLANGSIDSREAICVHGDVSGTVSSSIIFYSAAERRFRSFYSPGPPCRTPFGESLRLDVR
jgi:uncharacterized protein with NRDE domain